MSHPVPGNTAPAPGAPLAPADGDDDAVREEQQVRVQPTEYEVCCLPEDDINAFSFALTVRYRGNGRWAVQRGEHACLGTDGEWAQGVKEYDRGSAWLNNHRFDLDTALRMAREAALKVTVNGYTVADALAMYQRQTAGGDA